MQWTTLITSRHKNLDVLIEITIIARFSPYFTLFSKDVYCKCDTILQKDGKGYEYLNIEGKRGSVYRNKIYQIM